MRRLSSLLLCLLSLSCGKRSNDTGGGGAGNVVREDPAARALTEWDEESLVARARKSPECGMLEATPCDDEQISDVRCELAGRATRKHSLHQRLLADTRSPDRRLRAAALRVVSDLRDDASVKAVHDALLDADATIACRAAAYGIWFLREDAARLAELGDRCEGSPVIRATEAAVRAGEAGHVVKAGVTCEDIKGASR